MARALAERLRITRLFDTYGRLLTAQQQRWLRLYFHDDLSLGEIAERFAVTRQAVHDTLRRSTDELERFESLLHLVETGGTAERRRRALAARLAALEESVARLAARLGPEAAGELLAEVTALRRAALEA